jgi:phospholipase D
MKRKTRKQSVHRSADLPKHFLLVFFFTLGFASCYAFYEYNQPILSPVSHESPVFNVCFSPEGECEKIAVKAIQSAQKEILIQCYSFTSKPIADALLKAHKNGVMVKILFDRSQLKAPYSQIHRLIGKGITAKVDKVPGIAHNKIIIIDSTALVTGSYNFSKVANSRNAKNMLLIKDSTLIQKYQKEWQRRFAK